MAETSEKRIERFGDENLDFLTVLSTKKKSTELNSLEDREKESGTTNPTE